MDETQKGLETLNEFFSQFGEADVYTRVMWEVLFEELLDPQPQEDETEHG